MPSTRPSSETSQGPDSRNSSSPMSPGSSCSGQTPLQERSTRSSPTTSLASFAPSPPSVSPVPPKVTRTSSRKTRVFMHTPGHNKQHHTDMTDQLSQIIDYIVIGSDSGRIVILEYNPAKNVFEKVHQE